MRKIDKAEFISEDLRVRIKKFLIPILLMSTMFLIAWIDTAAAAVSMMVRPGLNGLYKEDQLVPLFITIRNSGSVIEGHIEVKPPKEVWDKGYEDSKITYRTEIQVPAGEEKEYKLMIPGRMLNYRPIVELVSEELVLAKTCVEGVTVTGSQVALVLGEGVMDSGLPVWASRTQKFPITLKYLSPQDLSPQVIDLAVADMILLDKATVTLLNDSQIKAIKDWVQLGGWIVFLGGAGAEGEEFADISPVRSAREKSIYTTFEGLYPGGTLKVVTGNLVAGEALVSDGGEPIIAARSWGKGQVMYCAANPEDLGSEADEIWSILLGFSKKAKFTMSRPERIMLVNTWHNLVDSSSYIPQLKAPPLRFLAILWLVYLILIGPLLYLILRRLDRRDWAWGIIPLGALVATLGFYMLAPLNKIPGQLSQTLATVDILGPQLAEVKAGTTAVVTRGGNLNIQGTEENFLIPVSTRGKPVTVYQKGDNLEIEFAEVEYGSMRQVSSTGILRNLGSIQGHLELANKSLQGELVNNTGLDLRDVYLFVGARIIKIGDFPAHKTINLKKELSSWRSSTDYDLFPSWRTYSREDPFLREHRMYDQRYVKTKMAAQEVRVVKNTSLLDQVQFLGWYDGPLGIIKITGPVEESQEYGLALVNQTLPLGLAQGKVYLPAGMVKPCLECSQGVGWQVNHYNGVYIENITLHERTGLLTYDLKELTGKYNLMISALEFPALPESINLNIEIHNQRDDKWEPLSREGLRITSEIDKYLTDTGKLEIRLTKRQDYVQDLPFWLGPAIEGEVL